MLFIFHYPIILLWFLSFVGDHKDTASLFFDNASDIHVLLRERYFDVMLVEHLVYLFLCLRCEWYFVVDKHPKYQFKVYAAGAEVGEYDGNRIGGVDNLAAVWGLSAERLDAF